MKDKTIPPLPQGIILLIEDDVDDISLFRLALAQSGSHCEVRAVEFAKDAISYLGRMGEYADEKQFPRPSLIVLDLSLPGMSGLEFLTWAKGEPPEKIPPIVVLTYSKLELNRQLSEKLGAKGYFVKSPNLEETVLMTKNLLLNHANTYTANSTATATSSSGTSEPSRRPCIH